MRLIVLQQEAMIADVICGAEAIYVGARDDCRVQLRDPRVAAQQAVIYPQADGWVVEQLAPECPLQLNSMAVAERAGLKQGDEIHLADFTIRVYPEFNDPAAGLSDVGTSREQLERFAASRLLPGTLIKKPTEPLTILPDQLARIGEINQRVAQSTQIEELMDVGLQVFLSVFAGQRAWIGVRRMNYGAMEYVEGRLITGQPTDLPELAEALKPRVLDRSQYLLIPRVSREDRCSVMAGPLRGPEGPLGMVYIDTGSSGRRFEMADLDLFILLTGVFAGQLDAVFRYNARNRAALIEGEVSVAHAIQTRLTPRKLPQWDRLQFGAFREMGRDSTGDIYDVVKLANGPAAFMVAHTPARGPLPSLLMAQAASSFRIAAMHKDPPNIYLRSLNWLLFDGERDHPLNCFAAQIDPDSGAVRYSAGGETYAYIIGNRGEARRLQSAEPMPPLGAAKAAAYPLLPECLAPAETLVVFSPGVITARNRAGETFGEERFLNILCDGFGQLASTMLKEMYTDLRNFTEGGTQPDDITVLMAHYVDE